MEIVLVCLIVLLVIVIYLRKRNSKVGEYYLKHILSGTDDQLPSYERILFSIKPIKDKYWLIEKEEIK